MTQPDPAPRSGARAAKLIATCTLLGSAGLVTRNLGGLAQRIDDAEQRQSRRANELTTQLDGVRGELTSIRDELAGAFRDLQATQKLASRLEDTEQSLGRVGAAIEAHSSSLVQLEEAQASFGPGLERELEERDERLLTRYEALNQLLASTQRTATESKDRLAELDQRLSPPDLERMWRDLVGPVVQLAGESSVGSGVLLASQATPEGDYRTYVVTAWHVVRDIQGDPPDLELPVPVQMYREDGTTRTEKAHLVCHDAKLDAALLELRTAEPADFGARLAPRARLDQVRIFDTVVAVGCPLGNDPIPTRGEIATCHHQVDGETYWMINAPTYIGNSGGGIFDSETHELMGIFSKIYTHGSIRPTIVPHMGLVTPLGKIYDWLLEAGHGDLVPPGASAQGS
jgi:S1-C subfamily serine protease